MQTSNKCDLVLYTTLYRGGGNKFEKAARTMEKNLQSTVKHPVVCKRIESKREFLQQFDRIKSDGLTVNNFHFFGHSGMYGIMFGSVKWPEQFSPYEWRQMDLPISSDSAFYFHTCRSGRWFAPFISRTLKIKAYGYHNYTTVSASPQKFHWDKLAKANEDLYIIACPGKKSHGVLGSIKKYSGCPADPMNEYFPTEETVDSSYDSVSHLYEETFENIKVRSDEFEWLDQKLSALKPETILDIGCGNGSFLNQLSPHFIQGIGVDASKGQIEQACKSKASNTKLQFQTIDGPQLPFPDNHFDVVMSTLAFRYLDWDPCMAEILRVLKPGGRILILDMVAAPVKTKELPLFIKSKTKQVIQNWQNPKFAQALKKMVNSPEWKKMLHFNPIRSEHEMKWYLESRFPGSNLALLNVGWHSRVLTFDSGPVHFKGVEKLSYP